MKALALPLVRRSFSAGALTLCMATAASATVHTVSNGSVTAQYNTIAAAMTAAATGDTLFISASGTSYGNFSVTKRLVFIGEAAWPLNGWSTRTGTITLNSGSAGSVFIGLHVESAPCFSIGVNNITIERCRLITTGGNDIVTMSGTRNGLIITHSYVYGRITLNNALNVQLTNNILCPNSNSTGNAPVQTSNQPTVLIRNNVFIDNNFTSAASLNTVSNAVLVNNIFYGDGSKFQTVANCVFNNNLSWQVPGITALPFGSNTGTGNLVNTDPQFVNAPDRNFTNAYDYAIQSGSPAENAGDDGTALGITGGAAPWPNYDGHPRVPRVTALTLPASSIQEGDDLNNVQAEGTKVD